MAEQKISDMVHIWRSGCLVNIILYLCFTKKFHKDAKWQAIAPLAKDGKG
jgi:hypothetical protein